MADRIKRLVVAVAVLGGAFGVQLALPAPAQADVSYTVTSTADVGDANTADGVCDAVGGIGCTLRAAFEQGDAAADDVNITVPAGTYSLTSGVSLTAASGFTFTVTGAGEGATVIDASATRAFDALSGSTLVLDRLDVANATETAIWVTSSSLQLRSVTLRNNAYAGPSIQGAVIEAYDSTTTLDDVTVRDNVYDGPCCTPYPGIVHNEDGDLTVTDSVFRDNTSTVCCGSAISNTTSTDNATATVAGSTFTDNDAPGCCGAIFNYGQGGGTAYLYVSDSTFTGNSAEDCCGAAIFSDNSGSPAEATITDSTFRANTADDCCGGAIYNGDDMSIVRSVVSGSVVDNSSGASGSCCGGGVWNNGDLEIVDSTISDNSLRDGQGGGIAHDGGTLTITGSTISGNRSNTDGVFEANGGGGGIHVRSGTVSIANSTISGNQAVGANQRGGGIFVDGGSLDLRNVTIADNDADDGAGIYRDAGTVAMANTIIADNDGANCVGGATSNDNNLDDDGTCAFGGPDDISNVAAGLAPLGSYGGPTATHGLIAGSPALDAGDTGVCGGPGVGGVDQRGIVRGSPCDIGAFEGTVAQTSVAVSASTVEAVEGGAPGAFTFTRSGSTASSLTVGYSVSGTATSGEDYEALGAVTFSPGSSSVVLPVTALADDVADDGETVIVTVLEGSGYTVTPPISATVTIVETATEPEPTPDAPPCDGVEPGEFSDVDEGNVHLESVGCLAGLGITEGGPQGLPADQFGPSLDVTRGQIASFLFRLIAASGAELPEGAPNAFADDDDSVHHDAINALVAAGVIEGYADGTFGAGDPVRRDQMASLLARAYELIAGSAIDAGPDAFTDDDGNVHEDAIDALAAAGVIEGTATPGIYDPGSDVRRDQMASFLIRLAELLASEGHFPVGDPPPAEG